MSALSKRFKEIEKIVDKTKVYSLTEAIDVLQKCPKTKFDQSVDVALQTGIDVKKSEQQIRGSVSLPNGIGKNVVVVAVVKGERVQDAKKAGADHVGGDELVEKIKNGWTEFDALVTTPDMMKEIGKLGKVLGPRGLMPTPKAGTITTDVAKAILEVKAGKVEFKTDKHGAINNLIGKLSFQKEKLVENIEAFIRAVLKAKPSTAKGEFLRSLSLSSTMGPGLKVDISYLTPES